MPYTPYSYYPNNANPTDIGLFLNTGSLTTPEGSTATILFRRYDDTFNGFSPVYVGNKRVYFQCTGTAIRGVDYAIYDSANTTLITDNFIDIPTNQAYETYYIRFLSDAIVEGNETVIITLLPDAAYVLPGTYDTLTFTISGVTVPTIGVVLKNAGPPISAAEPATNRYFRIQSFDPADLTASLAVTANTTVYYTMSGTATSGSDYTALSGSAVILNGNQYVDVLLTVIDDAIVENTETAIMTIDSNVGYLINSLYPSATMEIMDDDVAQVDQAVRINFSTLVTYEDPNFDVNKPGYGNVAFLFVSLLRPITTNLVVNFTLTGTAVRGVDYELFEDPNRSFQTGYLPLPTTVYTGATTFTFTTDGVLGKDFIIKALNDSIYKGYRSIIATVAVSDLYNIRALNSYVASVEGWATSPVTQLLNREEDVLWISDDEVSFIAPTLPTDPVDPGSPDYPVDGTSTIPIDRVVETENEFIEVSSITKTEPSECDITIEDVDGVILARIANNELSSVYQIIDVSELPWSTASGSTLDHYVEILYKKALPNLVNDGDEFPAIGYDDIVVNKMMQIFAEEQGNGKSAMAYDMKASRSLARMAEEENRATVDCVGFVSNAHDGLLRRVGSLLRLR